MILQFAAALTGAVWIHSVLLKTTNRSEEIIFEEAVQQTILFSIVILAITCLLLSKCVQKNNFYLSLRK